MVLRKRTQERSYGARMRRVRTLMPRRPPSAVRLLRRKTGAGLHAALRKRSSNRAAKTLGGSLHQCKVCTPQSSLARREVSICAPSQPEGCSRSAHQWGTRG